MALNDLEERVLFAMEHLRAGAAQMEEGRRAVMYWAAKARSDGVDEATLAQAAGVRPATLRMWLTEHHAYHLNS